MRSVFVATVLLAIVAQTATAMCPIPVLPVPYTPAVNCSRFPKNDSSVTIVVPSDPGTKYWTVVLSACPMEDVDIVFEFEERTVHLEVVIFGLSMVRGSLRAIPHNGGTKLMNASLWLSYAKLEGTSPAVLVSADESVLDFNLKATKCTITSSSSALSFQSPVVTDSVVEVCSGSLVVNADSKTPPDVVTAASVYSDGDTLNATGTTIYLMAEPTIYVLSTSTQNSSAPAVAASIALLRFDENGNVASGSSVLTASGTQIRLSGNISARANGAAVAGSIAAVGADTTFDATYSQILVEPMSGSLELLAEASPPSNMPFFSAAGSFASMSGYLGTLVQNLNEASIEQGLRGTKATTIVRGPEEPSSRSGVAATFGVAVAASSGKFGAVPKKMLIDAKALSVTKNTGYFLVNVTGGSWAAAIAAGGVAIIGQGQLDAQGSTLDTTEMGINVEIGRYAQRCSVAVGGFSALGAVDENTLGAGVPDWIGLSINATASRAKGRAVGLGFPVQVLDKRPDGDSLHYWAVAVHGIALHAEPVGVSEAKALVSAHGFLAKQQGGTSITCRLCGALAGCGIAVSHARIREAVVDLATTVVGTEAQFQLPSSRTLDVFAGGRPLAVALAGIASANAALAITGASLKLSTELTADGAQIEVPTSATLKLRGEGNVLSKPVGVSVVGGIGVASADEDIEKATITQSCNAPNAKVSIGNSAKLSAEEVDTCLTVMAGLGSMILSRAAGRPVASTHTSEISGMSISVEEAELSCNSSLNRYLAPATNVVGGAAIVTFPSSRSSPSPPTEQNKLTTTANNFSVSITDDTSLTVFNDRYSMVGGLLAWNSACPNRTTEASFEARDTTISLRGNGRILNSGDVFDTECSYPKPPIASVITSAPNSTASLSGTITSCGFGLGKPEDPSYFDPKRYDYKVALPDSSQFNISACEAPQEASKPGSIGTGVIVGIAVAGSVAVVAIGAVLFCQSKRRRSYTEVGDEKLTSV